MNNCSKLSMILIEFGADLPQKWSTPESKNVLNDAKYPLFTYIQKWLDFIFNLMPLQINIYVFVNETITWQLTSNSLAPREILMKFYIFNFQTDFSDWWLRHLLWNCPNMNVTGLHWWSVNIGSGNGLVLSGNKPLPEPMLTQICVTIWHH